ncbi:protease IV with duplicated peptidase family U7 domain-containing protein [Dunaliella salina]|uniref:Protease IV with duplicated peptidase family U7 domain-containing protein n=1 Tax=Dunaliella salina TaxID=3046 RepID=A0ABQ7GRB7_DUNSA|nr:protease IV with duplicated peptidase family U7 domain-containing protein [Dunaliella salina]|eukprot:KAF5837148.1 protease IV with duplicated peptidase family U7 domain-containing protein [Dunaliella salina]
MLNSKVLHSTAKPTAHESFRAPGFPARIHNRRAPLSHLRQRSASNDDGQVTTQPAPQGAEQPSDEAHAQQPSVSTEGLSMEIPFEEPGSMEKFWTRARLALALPWRRFKKGSVLTIKLEGELPDAARSWLDRGPGSSVPQLCQALQKAALDPRISGVAIEFGPLAAGYGKLMEVRRYLMHFRQSGKYSIAFMKQGGEKEYYLASACGEVYAPPTASISLRGFAVGGTFLRGVLDKVGVEPQVQRYGKYKSAGDQLLRSEMSDAQEEQLQALLDDVYQNFVSTVAQARGKTEEDVKNLLDAGIYDAKQLEEGGWLDGLKYEDEILEDLKKRTSPNSGQDPKPEKPLRKVGLKKYGKVSPKAFGLNRGKKRVVVLRTAGAIVGRASGSAITPDALVPQLRALAQRKDVVGVVLRVDSPGGDALASDLMWREIKKLSEKKPVIASMADVAASGGYYLAMGCQKIIAEPMTITGSIGVVTGKFNLAELYQKIGYGKKLISKGRYAELLADNRPFTEDENNLFTEAAAHAYASFRDKAAASRNMAIEAMQEVAQVSSPFAVNGRRAVW